MSKHGKRKRDSIAEDEAQQPAAKVHKQADGTKSEKKNSDRRQVRSERKKKSAIQAKQNAEAKRRQAQDENMPVSASDDIAAGQDFVSLGAPQVVKREKRRSPRSIRKEARERNAAIVAAETQKEYGKSLDTEKEARFICFVGNLPYSVTTEQIASHFSKIQPKSIRLSTDKRTGKPKGFAFLEFDSFDKMKTCLKIYHHSTFDPERADGDQSQQDPKSKARKINVELTAGGGGKSTDRKEKIKKKNSRLNEERSRDWAKKKQKDTGKGRSPQGDKKSRSEDVDTVGLDNRGDIHPSRMSRVQA